MNRSTTSEPDVAGGRDGPVDLGAPVWEDLLLYSLCVDTRRRFDVRVHQARTARSQPGRGDASASSATDNLFAFHSNKSGLTRSEFVDLFRRVLIERYV